MAKDKKLVESITSMDEDFAQWYTDIVKKAELIEYTSVKGCMVIRPYAYAIWENIQHILDGAFSFANEVPGALENAKHAEGFVKLTGLKVGGRTSVPACCCDACRVVILQYGKEAEV